MHPVNTAVLAYSQPVYSLILGVSAPALLEIRPQSLVTLSPVPAEPAGTCMVAIGAGCTGVPRVYRGVYRGGRVYGPRGVPRVIWLRGPLLEANLGFQELANCAFGPGSYACCRTRQQAALLFPVQKLEHGSVTSLQEARPTRALLPSRPLLTKPRGSK